MTAASETPQQTQRTIHIVGTAILGALVVVFDYTLKYSGLKIPLPWFPTLKFDFTGIPIVLSLLMYGFPSAAITSGIALLAILLRSGDLVSASMKALAEFATILGMALLINRTSRISRPLAIALGLASRVAIMSLLILALPSLAFLPSLSAAILFLPMLGAFNIIAGTISIIGGLTIYEAIKKRIPHLISIKD